MKTCGCGRIWSDAEWIQEPALIGPAIQVPADHNDCDCRLLTPAGFVSKTSGRLMKVEEHLDTCAGNGYAMELVNCPACKSTLARILPLRTR